MRRTGLCTADTWDNVRAYATVPSVREILVLAAARISAQLIRCLPDGNWPPDREPVEDGGLLRLDSIGMEVGPRNGFEGTYLMEGAG